MTTGTMIWQLALMTGLLAAPHKALVEKWVIQKSSSISIEGRSNVNSFRCEVIEYLRPDTILFCKENPGQQEFILRGGIVIDISRFDCHHQVITKDFRKTLRAGNGAQLKICLLSMDNFTQGPDGQKVKGSVNIELAGVSKKIELFYIIKADNNGYLHLYGEKQVLLSDFGLTPPKKMGGLIRVQQEIAVHFQLVLRAIPG